MTESPHARLIEPCAPSVLDVLRGIVDWDVDRRYAPQAAAMHARELPLQVSEMVSYIHSKYSSGYSHRKTIHSAPSPSPMFRFLLTVCRFKEDAQGAPSLAAGCVPRACL